VDVNWSKAWTRPTYAPLWPTD